LTGARPPGAQLFNSHKSESTEQVSRHSKTVLAIAVFFGDTAKGCRGNQRIILTSAWAYAAEGGRKMLERKRLNAVLLACSLLAGTALMACSSADSSKAKLASSSSKAAQGTSNRKETDSAIHNSQTQSQSSLDALRRGESPTTAAGSALREIYFDFDRYDLSSDARATLKAAGDWLRGNRSARVEIEGHCDERGTSEYNLALGAKRAQAAKDYLVSLGVDPGRLSTVSFGEEIPVCREPNESCWSKNRRDRFVVLGAKPGV
jgi:peptidoglycan-associated lipoprotein